MGWIASRPLKKTRRETRRVHVDWVLWTHQGRPMGDGTANVFLTSALTPEQLANKEPFTRYSTLQIGKRVDSRGAGATAIVLEMTYGIQRTSISPVSLLNKADCRSQTALRLLNLKRFPRTRPSWRASEEAAVQTARYRHTPPPLPPAVL